MIKSKKIKITSAILIIFTIIALCTIVYAEPQLPVKFGVNIEPSGDRQDVATSIQILLLLTVISLAPAILIMMTSFTRIVIILSFLRNALGTQQTPSNQVLVGLALFLTLFIMAPIGTKINNEALQPYLRQEINQDVAFEKAAAPVSEFMLKNTREKDLALFISLSGTQPGDDKNKLPLNVVIPAFIISELKTAFQFGFIIYIPFLVIDMVVASTLMSMGMMMLPPVMISLPFKLLLFIMVDGWNLIVQSIVTSFK